MNKPLILSRQQFKNLLLSGSLFLLVTAFLTACGGGKQEPANGGEKADTTQAAPSPAVEEKPAATIPDSAQTAEAMEAIEGVYSSRKRWSVSYADGDIPQGPMIILTIKRKDNRFVATEKWKGNDTGCGGSDATATADVQSAKKTAEGMYELYLHKTNCRSQGVGKRCEPYSGRETTPSENADFKLTFDLKDKRAVTISSAAVPTQCKMVWEFEGHTFKKR